MIVPAASPPVISASRPVGIVSPTRPQGVLAGPSMGSVIAHRTASPHIEALMSASANGDATMIRKVAATALSGHRAVWLSADGLRYADPADLSNADAVFGISTYAVAAGQDVLVQSSGVMVEPSWDWTPSEPLFLGPQGHLTHGHASDGVLVELGIALSPTSILIRIQQAIFL